MVADDAAGSARSRVPAVTRAVDVLDDIAGNGPATLAELARRVRLPKSSLLGICQTLVEERLLAQGDDGRYRLGLAIAELAEARRLAPPQLTAVGVTVQNLDNPFFTVEVAAIRAAVAERGATVDVRNAAQDVEAQCAQVDELVAQGVDVIVVDAVSSEGVGRVIERAKAASVPVVAVNVGAAGADATVTTDNVQAGQIVGRFLARRLRGAGRIAVVDGLPVTAVSDRITGFVSALRDFPGVTVSHRVAGDHSPEGGRRAVAGILGTGEPPDAIFAINDPTAEGVVAALAEHGLAVPVASVDGSARAIRAIADGGPLVATAAQDPAALGAAAVALAADLHAGRAVWPRLRLLPTRLITAADLPTYRGWG